MRPLTDEKAMAEDLRAVGITEEEFATYEDVKINPHPGQHIRSDLDELGMSAGELARALNVPTNRVTAILNGERGITADTALRLAAWLGTSAEYWLGLQQDYDLFKAKDERGERIREEVRPLKRHTADAAE